VRQVSLFVGDVRASREPVVLKTLLGSCVSACLRDPLARIGGMNHFMLPTAGTGEPAANLSRFGLHAMERLIGEIQKLGGERGRLEAKVFGGGHVVELPGSADGVPERNIRFIREFLAAEGIPLVAEDLGGRSARQLLFHTDTGCVLLKRLPASGAHRLAERERQGALVSAFGYGEVTLFGNGTATAAPADGGRHDR
jgi:chemotaxis protein CheD